MGYHTRFDFRLEEGPEEQYNRMLEDIDTLMHCKDVSSSESIVAKWYSYNTDIKQLSEKYPDITFSVNGDGEEAGDLWQDFWHAGGCYSEKVNFSDYADIKKYLEDPDEEAKTKKELRTFSEMVFDYMMDNIEDIEEEAAFLDTYYIEWNGDDASIDFYPNVDNPHDSKPLYRLMCVKG